MRMLYTICAVLLLLASVPFVQAEKIEGVVTSVEEKTISITTTSKFLPAAGDKLEIFVEIPDVGKARVATATVMRLQGDRIIAKIGRATGRVSAGQEVAIDSPKPVRRIARNTGDDRQKIQGRWICTDSIIDAERVAAGVLTELLIKADKLYWIGISAEGIAYTIVPSAVAGRIDYQLPEFDLLAASPKRSWFGPARFDGTRMKWVYELRGDWLTLASNHDASMRPESLNQADRQFRFRRMESRPGWDQPTTFRATSNPSLGVRITPTRKGATDPTPLAESGVQVDGVFPGSAGEKAGFRVGDVVETVAGEPTENIWRFRAMLRVHRIGDSIEFTIKRQGARLTLTAVLQEPMAITDQPKKLRPIAERGAAWAQFLMGQFYQFGVGISHDPRLAATWYRRAAEQGRADAQTKLGVLYQGGLGVEQDDSAAAAWYRKAAAQGYADAQTSLGNLYANGIGVEKNEAEAFRLYKLAAGQGNPRGAHNVGVFYSFGRSVARDDRAAVKWLRKAAARGQLESYAGLAKLYLELDREPRDVDEAMRWYRRGFFAGSEMARADLGIMYLHGNGVERDFARALALFRQAAKSNLPVAQVALGEMYRNGQGVEQDYKQAMRWFQKAADQRHGPAYVQIGLMIYNGQGVSRQYDRALQWCRAGLGKSQGDAETAIGMMYEEGKGVARDYREAINYYNKGRDAGSRWASYRLAMMHKDGRGVSKRIPTGLFREAAQRGDAEGHLMYAWALEEEAKQKLSTLGESERRALILKHLKEAHRMGVKKAAAELRRWEANP